MTDGEKIEEIQRHLNLTWKEMARKVGLASAQTFTDIRSGKHGISMKLGNRIVEAFPDIRREWVMFGQGAMLKQNEERGIKFYDTASSDGNAIFDENRFAGTIDVGSCFPNAEIAVRNNSDSMTEYPIGCIIVLRRVCDVNLLIPGSNYLVETDEFSVVKRYQKGKDDAHIALYSSNTAKYPDGRLVYEPFEIPMDSVKRIFSILGYIYTQTTDINKL